LGNGLVVVDVSNPAAPTLKGSYDTAWYSEGIAVAGDYAYLADLSSGLVVVDVSDPAVPTLKGSYDTVGFQVGWQWRETMPMWLIMGMVLLSLM